jgi:ABC-2 type transport system permease protein
MLRRTIGMLSFFWKEVNEILRQPRLVVSLILGPFLVLLLFGLTYNGGIPKFRVVLVAPPDSIPQDQLGELEKAISANFILVSSEVDHAAAMEMLQHDEADIVEILPTGIEENIMEGRQSTLEFHYLEVNPFDESWIQYLGSAQISEMNRMLLEQAISGLQTEEQVLSDLQPNVVISPLAPQYTNQYGSSLSFVNFYGPGVLALVIQHIAVTLGALSLVHEQSRGTLEMFHIAPVSSTSIIGGKYLGYTLFVGILTAVLVGLLLFLGTPFLGSIVQFAFLTLLFIIASLGIGFMISCVSNTDSTAMQLSMLMLLFSLFFSGFFLPLENFDPSTRGITKIIPLTHGLLGFQEIMLKGTQASLETWTWLGMISIAAFLGVQILFRWQMKHL